MKSGMDYTIIHPGRLIDSPVSSLLVQLVQPALRLCVPGLTSSCLDELRSSPLVLCGQRLGLLCELTEGHKCCSCTLRQGLRIISADSGLSSSNSWPVQLEPLLDPPWLHLSMCCCCWQGGERQLVVDVDDKMMDHAQRSVPRADVAEL